MKKLTITGHVDESGKPISNRQRAIEWFKSIPNKGFKMTLEEDRDFMIDSHRGYYFAVVVKECLKALRDTCGYDFDETSKDDIDEVHDFLKKEFLSNGYQKENAWKETITIPPSTTRLDDEGWVNYLRRIVQFAAEMWQHEIPRKIGKYYFPDKEF
jgi:hypothetical protein